MATTIQRKYKTENKLYDNLVNANLIGSAPTLLNLDGDLFKNHFDSNKYYSKEAANEAEDSFPYWVINIVKKIKDAEPLIKPKENVEYSLPYYIQNISNEDINIFNVKGNIIGKIPPTGIEPIFEIINGAAKLLSSPESTCAIIKLNDQKIIPVQHLISEDELKPSNLIKYPDTEIFNVKCKQNIKCRKGINNHYDYSSEKISKNDVITINKSSLFLDSYYITDNNSVIPLTNDNFKIYTKENKNTKLSIPQKHTNIPTKKEMGKYKVVINLNNRHNGSKDMIIKTLHNKLKIDINYLLENNNRTDKIICGDFNDQRSAIIFKKKIISTTGYKAIIE